jgi:hypothetical protein
MPILSRSALTDGRILIVRRRSATSLPCNNQSRYVIKVSLIKEIRPTCNVLTPIFFALHNDYIVERYKI